MLSDNSDYHCIAPVEQLRYVQDANLDNTNKIVNLGNPSSAKSNAEIFGDTGSVWSQARECYARDVGYDMATKAVVGLAVLSASGNVDIIKDCSIGGFVQNHTKNYITLTNVVNPDIIGITDPVLRAKKANIYYRVIAEPDVATDGNTNGPNVLPREYAEIKADGYAGKTKQSIDVQYKLNSFLPVFNFSLYKTDTSKSDTDSSNNVGLGSLN